MENLPVSFCILRVVSRNQTSWCKQLSEKPRQLSWIPFKRVIGRDSGLFWGGHSVSAMTPSHIWMGCAAAGACRWKQKAKCDAGSGALLIPTHTGCSSEDFAKQLIIHLFVIAFMFVFE